MLYSHEEGRRRDWPSLSKWGRRRRPRNKEERKEVSDYNKSVIISAEPGLYFPRQKLSSRTCEGDMLCDVKKM